MTKSMGEQVTDMCNRHFAMYMQEAEISKMPQYESAYQMAGVSLFNTVMILTRNKGGPLAPNDIERLVFGLMTLLNDAIKNKNFTTSTLDNFLNEVKKKST